MKRLIDDISKKICLYSVLAAVVIGFLLWIAQLLRYINFVTNASIPTTQAFAVCAWLLPESLSVAIPIAFALAVGIVYSKMISTNQMVSMFFTGANYSLVLSPIVNAGICIAFAYYVDAFYLAPSSLHHFYSFKQEFSNAFVIPKDNTVLNYQNVSFFIGSKDDNSKAYNVIVHDKRNKNRLATLMADEADISVNSKNIALSLKNGQRLAIREGNISKIAFDKYETLIPTKHSSAEKQYNEKVLHELLMSTRPKDQAILHQKITSPFSMMISGLLVGLILLLSEFSRSVHITRYLYATLIVALTQSMNVFLMKIAIANSWTNVLFYAFYLAVFINLMRYIKSL